MQRVLIPQLDAAITNTAWNYCGDRLAAVASDGIIRIYDDLTLGRRRQQQQQLAPCLSVSAQWKAEVGEILKVVWAPPEHGDVIACGCANGSILIWEEVTKGETNIWIPCASLHEQNCTVLDVQFGNLSTGLKLVAFYADGYARIYETLDVLNLTQWQLQAEFQNVKSFVGRTVNISYFGASICWRGPIYSTQLPAFVLGCQSSSSSMSSAKVWVFEHSRQRWFCIAELEDDSDGEENNAVTHVSWAPNTGRSYEIIAVASGDGVSIWHLHFSNPSNDDGSAKRVARLSGFVEKVWQVEWDMTGMTLAISGSDGIVRLWQANLKGEWQQCAQVPSA